MIDIKQTCIPGTVIRYGNSRRALMNRLIDILLANGYNELSIPILQYQGTFENKVGEKNNNIMYNFKDRGERQLSLAPEYTAIIQELSKEFFKYQRNVKIFYIQDCFRAEKLEENVLREFCQIGVEIINPTDLIMTPDREKAVRPLTHLTDIAEVLIKQVTRNFYSTYNTDKTFEYYINNKGFSISSTELKTQEELCSGGEYEGGVGFGLNFDKLVLLKEKNKL